MRNGRDKRQAKRIEQFRQGKIRPSPMRRGFTRFASAASDQLAAPWAFAVAVAVIVGWAVSGPVLGFSEEWMLVINTITTIVTFLMVFVIQNTQSREAKAIQLKLDELIRAMPGAHEEYMEAEEEDLEEILREKAIVAKADPSPPEDKKDARGNGEAKEKKKAS